MSKAVNCGDDTDCTGATVGAIMGIMRGESKIPKEWKSYIGEEIKTVAIGGFEPPKTISELSKRTLALGMYAHSLHGLADAEKGEIYPSKEGCGQTSLNAYRVEHRRGHLGFGLDLVNGVTAPPGSSLDFKLSVRNLSPNPVQLELQGGDGVKLESERLSVEGGKQVELRASAILRSYGFNSFSLVAKEGGSCHCVPFALFGTVTPSGMTDRGSKNQAVEYKDARAVDETGRSAGSVIHAIVTDDPTRTWHSSTSSARHEVTISFASEKEVSEVIINFAPRGRPVDFSGYLLKGEGWEKVFEERGYDDPVGYRKAFPESRTKAFKLVIERTTDGNAAELSQIEIYRSSYASDNTLNKKRKPLLTSVRTSVARGRSCAPADIRNREACPIA
ncbi:ADP-ribosylglycohydrolase family protein [Tardisphaera miroshnichenkoae]